MSQTPKGILEIGLSFQKAQVLLSAVGFRLFTILAASGPLTRYQITRRLKLPRRRPRMIQDWLDALVSMDLLVREHGRYSNTPDTNRYLVEDSEENLLGMLEMCRKRMYLRWGDFSQALREDGGNWFPTMHLDPERLKNFLRGMSGRSAGIARFLAELPLWAEHNTFCDTGCALGVVPVQIALRHPHITGGGLDLPEVKPHFEEYVASHGLADRLRFYPRDFFKHAFPKAKVIILGRVLHDWSKKKKLQLLRKAYRALPEGGILIVYDVLIDDERRIRLFALLTSLHIALDTPEGFDYTPEECIGWMKQVGFQSFEVFWPQHLSEGVIIARK